MTIIQHNYCLKKQHTMQLQSSASSFMEITSLDDLLAARDYALSHALQIKVLGDGSNTLMGNNIAGLVCRNNIKGIRVDKQTEDFVWLTVMGGESWHEAVSYCVEHGWSGIENLALIPGRAGAAPIQNIGAYGAQLSDCLTHIEVFDLKKGGCQHLAVEELGLGYRDSKFKHEWQDNYFIISISLKLSKKLKPNISHPDIVKYLGHMKSVDIQLNDIYEGIIAIRQSKLPDWRTEPNVGSFFKNPKVNEDDLNKVKQVYPDVPNKLVSGGHQIAAAALIEFCNLKGFSHLRCQVSSRHALVLINYNNGDLSDLMQLVKHIQNAVFDKFGIYLEIEPSIWASK